jgi:hypothetical protein
MSRTKVSVKTVVWDLARALGYEPDTSIDSNGISDILTSQLLRCINSAHEDAYNANEWEDAWQDGTLTPTSGVIPFSDISDAARFTLWSEDPRPVTSSAYPIRSTTSVDGIQVQASVSTVFGFWLPQVAAFTDATSTTPVILESIASAVVDLARAEYLQTSGQHETAGKYEAKGRAKLEDRWAVEFQRVSRAPWLKAIS